MGAWNGMLVLETVAKIRRAYFFQKKTIKAICRELRVSRNVVRKVLRPEVTEFHYERREQPLPRIGPWQVELDRMLASNEAKSVRERLALIRVNPDLRWRNRRAGARSGPGTDEAGILLGDAGQGSARAAGGMPEEVIARDDRPWASEHASEGGDQPPAVVYSYAPGRGHIHANALLGGYRGILQRDGYAAFKKFGGSKSADAGIDLLTEQRVRHRVEETLNLNMVVDADAGEAPLGILVVLLWQRLHGRPFDRVEQLAPADP
jgi:hypothetical protein